MVLKQPGHELVPELFKSHETDHFLQTSHKLEHIYMWLVI